jgi:cbb3-type cytochrome oxidase subunit 3
MQNEFWGLVGLLLVVLGFVYIVWQEKKKRQIDPKLMNMRMQAAERMILFLERIKPENLLPRIGFDIHYLELQQRVLQEIKQELDHNVAQQLYLSTPVWDKIKWAANTTSASLMHSISTYATLQDTKQIVVQVLQHQDGEVQKSIEEALQAIKDEVHKNF